LIGQGIFHGDKKSRDLHEKSRVLSNYEIFQHKILKSQSFKKRTVYWYFYATMNIFFQLKLLTDHQFCTQFNMKVDNDVLLHSYLDKIRLTLTGNLWRALVSLYSGARLYKGPRTETHPQSTTLHSTGNISV
jgi:hypothetical protein